MQSFRFHTARSLNEALDFLNTSGNCQILAGGTDLIPALHREEVRPDWVLNLLDVRELRGIGEDGPLVRVGPLTTFTEMTDSEIVTRCFPLLGQAAAAVGGPQVRNRGTIGGNIAHASPAADVLPAVLALNSELEIASKREGRRIVPLGQAVCAPYHTCLRADEILTAILIPKLTPGTATRFIKLGRRNALARARINLSGVLRLDEWGRISEVRLVPGAVMPIPCRMNTAEGILLGEKPGETLFSQAARAVADEMVSQAGMRRSTEYKYPVLQNLVKEMLRRLAGPEGGLVS